MSISYIFLIKKNKLQTLQYVTEHSDVILFHFLLSVTLYVLNMSCEHTLALILN